MFRRLLYAATAIGTVLAALPAAALSDRIVHDPTTGMALSGYDPVAYFIDGRPVPGKVEIEVALAGAFWRFENEGNAEAFRNAPDIYIPAYGGHSPIGASSGVARPGRPDIFMTVGRRLFLFYDHSERRRFAEDPGSWIALADAKWPSVLATLPD